MRFKSKKDLMHSIIYLAIAGGCLALILLGWIDKAQGTNMKIWLTVMMGAIAWLMLWIFTGTYYEIEEEKFLYSSGPFTGSIDINSIHELDVNKTMYSGYKKPATALNGIIVKYNKFDDLYISPEDNEEFVRYLLDINPKIKVNRF